MSQGRKRERLIFGGVEVTWRREAEMVRLARSRCHRPPLRVTWRSEGGKKGEGTSELDLTVSLY